jgi:hypothetical protein
MRERDERRTVAGDDGKKDSHGSGSAMLKLRFQTLLSYSLNMLLLLFLLKQGFGKNGGCCLEIV